MAFIDEVHFQSVQRDMAMDEPALLPPHDVDPDFDHPQNNNHLAHAILAASLAFTSIVILARAYSRIFCSKRVSTADCKL